jgi:FdhD protein
MEATYDINITKIVNNKRFNKDDIVIREIKLQIDINDKESLEIMATPIDQKALVVGYLKSENIIDSIDDIKHIDIIDDGTKIKIKANIDEDSLQKLNSEGIITSGCGYGKSANIDPNEIEAKIITSNYSISSELLINQMQQFYKQCPLYEQTGCVHTAKLYIDDTTSFIAEDIAQHNTIDKAIGKAMLNHTDISKSFLMVSGRLSAEMVAKAVMHQIPIIASRTAPTCLGIQIAKKFGITLIGFVRNQNMNIYQNPQRIL